MNTISYFEFAGSSSERLAAFYEAVFGWTPSPGPFPGYLSLGESSGAGLPGGFREEEKPEVVLYIEVANLEAALEAVVAAGGRILIPPTLVPGVTHFALFEDPCGNKTGLLAEAG